MKNYILFLLLAAGSLYAQVNNPAPQDCVLVGTPGPTHLTDTHNACANSQTVTVSGTSITIRNQLHGMTPSFEELFTGGPATVSVPIAGCMTGGTCDTLETYTTPTNSIRSPALTKTYDYFIITPTWTGGTGVTFTVNTSITTSRAGTVGGGGGGSSTAGIFNILSYGAICDGAHMAADTSGIKAAISAAGIVGGQVFVPAGNCLFDNSAGAYVVGGFTGQLVGVGKASSIAFSTLANDGFDFNAATNLDVAYLSFSFTPATTTRGGGYPLNLNACSNCTVNTVYFNNGNLSGLRVGNSNNVKLSKLTVTNFLANGIYTINNTDLHFVDTTCSNNGDACEEYSFYDSAANPFCYRITSTGMSSTNDVTGFLVNSCSQVSLSNFSIKGAAHQAIFVGQDPTTTTVVFPDDVQIANGSIVDTGYGANAININTARGIAISINGTPATFQNVGLSNIKVKHTAGRGLELGDNGTVNLSTNGLEFDDAGNGSTSATGEAIYSDGNIVQMSNTLVRNAGTYSLRNHLGKYFTSTGFVSVNPNQLGNAITNAILNEVSGLHFKMDGVALFDTWATANRSGISSTATTGVQDITGVTSICTVACTTPTVSNTGIVSNAQRWDIAPTTAVNGYITQNGARFLHSFGGITELFLGTNAGNFALTGVNNVGLGESALTLLTTGNKNTAVGAFAGQAIVTGAQDTVIGNSAFNAGTGSSNVAIGAAALNVMSAGNNSTCVGAFCLILQTGAGPNTCVGENCQAVMTTGVNNTCMGISCNNGLLTTETKVSALGDFANQTATAGITQSTAIGYSAQNTASNQIMLGTPTEFVAHPGTYGFVATATAALTAGQVVKVDTANPTAVVTTATTDTGGGIAVGLMANAPAAGGVAEVAVGGIRNAFLGTGTCAIGQFIITDTTTPGRVQCTSTYTAGTVIGKALTAQATIGSAVSVLIGLR